MGNRRRIFRPENNGEEWTADEDKVLRELFAEGSTYSQIGDLLKRTRGAVEARVQMWKQAEAHDDTIREASRMGWQGENGNDGVLWGQSLLPEKARDPEGQLYEDGTCPPQLWDPAQSELFKSAVRLWTEGQPHMAIQMLCNANISKLDHRASLEAIDQEITALTNRVAIRERGWRKDHDLRNGREQCTGCASDCLHLLAVEVRTKPHSVKVDAGGVHLRPGAAGCGGRGSSVCIEYECDCCGDRFMVERYFHKGGVLVQIWPITGEAETSGELWRD